MPVPRRQLGGLFSRQVEPEPEPIQDATPEPTQAPTQDLYLPAGMARGIIRLERINQLREILTDNETTPTLTRRDRARAVGRLQNLEARQQRAINRDIERERQNNMATESRSFFDRTPQVAPLTTANLRQVYPQVNLTTPSERGSSLDARNNYTNYANYLTTQSNSSGSSITDFGPNGTERMSLASSVNNEL